MIAYEVGCFSNELGPLSHREEYYTKRAAFAAAKRLIRDYQYIEVTLLEKDELGNIEEGNVIETFRR